MKKIQLVCLCLVFFSCLSAQNIGIGFRSLTKYGLADSILNIKISITSDYEVATVVAAVSGRQVSLAYNSQSTYFEGSLSLAGLPQDTLSLQVTATDVFANQKVSSLAFIYDKPPSIIIYAPLNATNATPMLHVKAKCIDTDTCTLTITGNIQSPTDYPILTTRDSVDIMTDLSKGDGNNQVYIRFIVTDKRGQSSSFTRQVNVESSPYLTEIYRDSGQICDFNYGKVLSTNDNAYPGYDNKITDIITGSTTTIPYYKRIYSGGQSRLTPYGAIFMTWAGSSAADTLKDWNRGNLYTLGAVTTSGGGSALAGSYVVWVLGTKLYLRDLDAMTTTLISSSAGNNQIAPAASGMVAYSFQDTYYQNIAAYKNGTTTKFPQDKINIDALFFPETDGKNIFYLKRLSSNFSYSLTFFDGTTHTDVSANLKDNTLYNYSKYYQLNNGYGAYTKPGSTGQLQIWLRDTSGNQSQLTFYGSGDSWVDYVSPNGDVTYTRGGGRIYRFLGSRSTGQIKQIGSSLGKVYYRDNTWYLTLGRSLYRIDTSLTPNVLGNMAANGKKDSVYSFDKSAIVDDFTGSGELMYLTVTQLPKNGVLKLNGANVAANTQIIRADLDKLTYTPNNGFSGADTLYWDASNGITYTGTPALVKINIQSILMQPVITGISSSYCSSLAVQQGKLSNLPLAVNGVTTVTLDATAVPVGADSSFSFDVSTLSAGTHTLSVTYTNAAGSSTSTASFSVAAAVSPDVNASTNITNIVNTTDAVMVTAANASGGGSTPLYTFAKDRGFTNILQAEGSSNQYAVNTTSLPMGDNWIYVRMKTSASCYTTQTNIDSIKLYKLLVPVQPIVTGLTSSYCGNQGVVKVKISNPPAAEYLATVSVVLDGATALTVAADSTVSINPATLSAGNHSVKTSYTNSSGFKADTSYFAITQAVTPDVNLSANITTIVNLTDNVVVTAANAAGGGSSPLYTFGKDKAMTNILQAESGTNTLTIAPGTLAVGANWIYVRMKTSSACYTVQTNVDSIKIDRSSVTGLVDVDNPGQVIMVYPNPFKQGISISGLSTAKTYLITVSDASGKEVFRQQVSNSSNFVSNKHPFINGSYWLRIYDYKKKRLIGTSLLIRE